MVELLLRGVIAIACWQAVGVVGVRIAKLPADNNFNASSYRWLSARVGCLLAFIVLIATAFIALNVLRYMTPGVLLGLIAGGLLALVAVGSLALFLGTRPQRGHYSQG